MNTTALLDMALRAAGIPIVGVSVGRVPDKGTWAVTFAADATDEQRAAGAALMAAFDPASREVTNAIATGEAEAITNSRQIRAFWLWFFREIYRRDPTNEERTVAQEALLQAYKDAATDTSNPGEIRTP